ncbi:tRNA lysidine(34) synthetase TilS [Shinella pollutisoli]|uniref:tRNA lysidine(34) synthetase TilS n=1 Tax=Shinella pollutisoli TaxID=2250594 RepID=UPI002148C189|nr:tRNA lysidine(34) synthetase TilS [Shinella pollutisoli]
MTSSATDGSVAAAADRFLSRFRRPVKFLLAVSGGSDSTGLLVALATLVATGRYPGISLAACTVDHALRPRSADEARAVAALCARYGIPHSVRRWDGPKPVTGLQAAARTKRYDLLLDAAAGHGADAILTAHTGDDQRETIAMRAGRAAGGVGLSGMADAVLLGGRVWLFRPLLSVDRAEIRRFLESAGEEWIDDPSNANPRFERVRVREGRPEAMAEAVDRLALSRRAAEFLDAHVRALSPLLFLLPPEGIATALADPAAWRGLMLLAATTGGRVHAPETASADRIRTFLADGTLSRLTAGRVVFDRRRAGLFLYRERRGIEPLVLPAGGTATWDGRLGVANRGSRPLVVSAAGATIDPALRGAARRAAEAAPRFGFADGGPAPADRFTVEPLIAPYARFLPGFDLPVAQALARLLGRAPFPSPPNG